MAVFRYMARSFTLILPYFPTGTMERVDLEGQIATAKVLIILLFSFVLKGLHQFENVDLYKCYSSGHLAHKTVMNSTISCDTNDMNKML